MKDVKGENHVDALREMCIKHFVADDEGYSREALAAVREQLARCARASSAMDAGRTLVWVAHALHETMSAPTHAQQLVTIAHGALGLARGAERASAARDGSLRAFAGQRRVNGGLMKFRFEQIRETP